MEELLFLHQDEFEKQFSVKQNYPVILQRKGNRLQILASKSEIEEMK